MVRWSVQAIQPSYPLNSGYPLGKLIPDVTTYDNITFTQVRCSAFSVCGLTTNGSIMCSGVPLPTDIGATDATNVYVNVTSPDYIVDNAQMNPPIGVVGLMEYVRGQYCATIKDDHSIRCDESSKLNGQMPPFAVRLAPVGSYRMGGGTELFPCPGNVYSTRHGAESSACDGPCKAGYAGRNSSQSFSNELCGGLCSPGYYCILGNNGPAPCPAGLYGVTAGLTTSECTSVCPSGSYCPAGSTNPTACPAGVYGATQGLTNASCSGLCQAGYVCPPGSTSPTQHPCQVNTYNLLNGSLQCLSCSGLALLDCGGGVVTLKSSFHASIRLTKSNDSVVLVELATQPCPVGFCAGIYDGITSRVNMTAVGLYAASDSNTPILLPLTDQCTAFHDQSTDSSLCGSCVEGYALSTTGACEPCNSIGWIKIFLYIFVPWIFVIIFYVLAHGHSGTLGVFLYLIQTIVIMLNSQTSAWLYPMLSIIGFSPLVLIENQCIGKMSVEMYFALPLFVPAMQMLQLAVIIIIHSLLKRSCMSSQHDDVVLNESSMCYILPDRNRRWYNSLQWYSFILMFRLWPELTVSTITRTVVLIAMASFTSTTYISMSWLDCSGTGINDNHVIWSFPAITCYTTSYWRWSILYIFVLVSWTTIFLVMLLRIWRYRQFISALQSTSILSWMHVNTSSSDRLVPLFAPSVALVPVAALASSSSSSSPPSWYKNTTMPVWLWSWYWPLNLEHNESNLVDMQAPVTHMSRSSAIVDDVSTSAESRMSYAFRSVYSAVWDSYTPQAVGWMVIILLRRLLLLILSVSLSLYPKWKYLSFAALHLSILFVHNAYQPYTQALVNQVEQMSIVVHLIMAIILAADLPEMTDDLEQAVFTSLTVIPVLTLIFMTAFHHATTEQRKEQVRRTVSLRSLSLSAHQQFKEPFLASSVS